MQIIEKGHIYKLDTLDGYELDQKLTFVNRENNPHEGVQTQEVLRVLIDRTKHCDQCLRWEGNDLIIKHLRMAIALHEARAVLRKVEAGLEIEYSSINKDGHLTITQKKAFK